MLTTRQQQLEVECETKTKDDVFVLIRAAVQYKIDDTNKESIERASYSLENPRQQMAAFVHDVLR